MCDMKPALRGILNLHSETGSEGGYWAFQDERYIVPNTTQFRCAKCNKFWDKEVHPEGPLPERGPSDGIIYIDTSTGAMSHEEPEQCATEAHDFKPWPSHWWSYDGLHFLKDGDQLTIYAKDDPVQVVWEGVIRLHQHGLFTEHAFGMWIHADQAGVARETWARWFFENLPAKLVRA